MKRLIVSLFILTEFVFAHPTDLFFSEYAEGSSNNKYIEIYNGTGTDVDLSGYSLSSCSNGCNTTDEWDYPDNVTFASGTIITDGDVFVVYHGSADAAIAAEGDQTFTYLSNGDDVFALTAAGATADTYTIIDIVGDMGGDPGSGWEVAGVTNATKDHTLVRKATVTSGNTDWTSSAGTTTEDSEWIVYEEDYFNNIGFHIIELYSAPVYYVSASGSDANEGSEDEPFATIQHGIDAASDGDTVFVAPGTYVENINFNGKNIVVIGEDWETTIIDGNQSGSVVTFESGEDSTAVLNGFTLANGSSSDGGGIYCLNSSPTLMNVTITNNSAAYGGGICCKWSSNPTLTDIIITGNSADINGGGIFCRGFSHPSLLNVTITNNLASYGGGIYCWDYSNPSFENVTITDNSASDYGGGIFCSSNTNPILMDVTITNNSASYGGGMYCEHSSNPSLVNCILWNDSPQEVYFSGDDNPNSIVISYSDIQGGEEAIVTNDNVTVYWEEGNIDADPLFVDADNDDLHLLWGSPCIDAGDPDLDGDGITWETDTDDQDPNGTRMDMGAFYFSQFFSDFIAEPISGFVPLEVQFTDHSYGGSINWEWDFNDDGIIDSYEQNPTYTYTQSGLYTVSLIVSDGTNEEVEIKEDYIHAFPTNLIITEIMQNPSAVSDGLGEWFEIFNPGNMYVDLIGCVIKDNGTDYHVIDSSLYIEAGQYYVLGNNADSNTNGGVNLGYQYSNISLGNGSDEIILITSQGTFIDSVAWDNGSTFPDPTGASMALFDTDLDNSSGSNWTVSVTPYGDGDLGTPGIPNFNPTILVSDDEIIFTDVMVGLSATYNLEITNIGNGGLIINNVYFDNDVFNSSFTTAIIEVGDPILLSIMFTPLAVETYSANLFIETNDYNNQLLSIGLLGYGIAPNPNIYINPDTLDFGIVDAGDTNGVYLDFTIYNIGVNDLEIDEVQFGLGTDSPFFTTFEEATIESGESILVTVGYIYQDQWIAFEDTLYVYSNDPDEGVYELPIIVVTPTNSPPVITSDDSVTANEDSYFIYTATAIDPEDSTIIFSFDQLAQWLTAEADSVYGTPSDSDTDTSFLVIASDGELENTLVVFIDIIHINDPPNDFALLFPEEETIIQTLTPLFEWEASFDPDLTDTVSYTLFYGDSIPALQIIEIGTEMSYQVSSALNDNTTYFWKVIAADQNGSSTENINGYQRFYTNLENEPPSTPVLVAPLNGSIQTDLTPNFYWTEATDPDPLDHVSYTMNWWPTGVLPVIYSINTDSTGVSPDEDITDNSQFGWMVVANDMHNSQSTSDSSYFYSDAFPEPPLNFATVSPINNVEGLATEVEFVWEETDDPDPVEEISYRVVYATNWEDSSTYVYSETIQDTSMVITLADNSQYNWLVEALDSDGFIVGSNNNTPNAIIVGTLAIDGADIPTVFALHQNYPNPFNPITTLRYDLPENSYVNVTVYDMLGREVKTLVNSTQDAGFKSVIWNATNDYGKPVSAGVYLYKIQAGEFVQTKKMVLLK